MKWARRLALGGVVAGGVLLLGFSFGEGNRYAAGVVLPLMLLNYPSVLLSGLSMMLWAGGGVPQWLPLATSAVVLLAGSAAQWFLIGKGIDTFLKRKGRWPRLRPGGALPQAFRPGRGYPSAALGEPALPTKVRGAPARLLPGRSSGRARAARSNAPAPESPGRTHRRPRCSSGREKPGRAGRARRRWSRCGGRRRTRRVTSPHRPAPGDAARGGGRRR